VAYCGIYGDSRSIRGMATTETAGITSWIPDDSTFGARLALVRQRMGWNISTAATRCELDAESWRAWEKGRRPRDLQVVCEHIADATDANYAWLLGGSRTGSR
jgi:hypothetical protein